MGELATDPLQGSGKYRTVRELGRGGMGEVFEAQHIALGTPVVVKLLHAELAGKTHLVDRMRLEAQALARLDHPNIVRVTDFDTTATGRPYFVMEFLEGRSLRAEVNARGGFLPVLTALDMTQQALTGLAAAHEAGLVHRDIKLDNLYVCAPSQRASSPDRPNAQVIKLLDFGVAKVQEGAADAPAPLAVPTGTGVVVGTPRFFAPEQARGKPLDHRADLYATGLVLYSLVAGRGPFDYAKSVAEMAKAHVFTQPEPPSRWATQPIPPELDAAVLRALSKAPEQRFQSAAEFAEELTRIATGLQGGAAAEPGGAAHHPPAETPQPLSESEKSTERLMAKRAHEMAAAILPAESAVAPGAAPAQPARSWKATEAMPAAPPPAPAPAAVTPASSAAPAAAAPAAPTAPPSTALASGTPAQAPIASTPASFAAPGTPPPGGGPATPSAGTGAAPYGGGGAAAPGPPEVSTMAATTPRGVPMMPASDTQQSMTQISQRKRYHSSTALLVVIVATLGGAAIALALMRLL